MLGLTRIDVYPSTMQPQAASFSRLTRWLQDWSGGDDSDSGVEMNSTKALSYAAVFQAIQVLAGDIGQLPLDLFRRVDERNKEKDRKHPAFPLMRRQANPYMSAATLRETLMLYTLIHGNGVAEIARDSQGRPVALWPLIPHRTRREIVDGQLWYFTKAKETDEERTLRFENVLHIRNFGPDGTWGYSTVTLARNSWGLGLAGEKYANRYFRNNGTPSGVLEHPGRLSEEAANNLRRDWKERHEGLDNATRVAILEEAMTFKPLSFNHKDSQWLESRVHQKRDVASWFNLPPHKLGDMEDANYSNMVEAERHYLNTGLRRWQVKWEDECYAKLLTEREKRADSHFFQFNNDALLQADLETRAAAYSTALGGHPYMTPNEVRGKDNMNTIEGGDELPTPLNMSTGEDQEQGRDESASDNSAVVAQIRELLLHEARMVPHAAKGNQNFVDWVDAFYGQWPKAVGMVLGVPSTHPALVHWAATDKAWCLGAAGRVTDRLQLHGIISATVAGWALRAEQIAGELEAET